MTEKNEHQAVTRGIFYCRVSAGFNVSASNKVSCSLTGQCFEIGNKNIPPYVGNKCKKTDDQTDTIVINNNERNDLAF